MSTAPFGGVSFGNLFNPLPGTQRSGGFPGVTPPAFGAGTAGSAATSPTGAMGGVNDFIKSPLGQLILGGIFGGLESKGQADLSKELLAQQQQGQLQQTGLGALAAALSGQQQHTLARDLSTQTRLGEYNDYAKRQAMTPLVLAMMQQPMRPGNPRIAAAMGSVPQLPAAAVGRLTQLSSPTNTAAAIYDYDRDRLSRNPNAGVASINTYTPGVDNTARERALALQRAQTQGRLDAANANQLSLLQKAIAANPAQAAKKSGTSAGTRIGGALSGAASGAQLGTMIAPGIGTGIGAALGGLAGLFR